MKAAGRAVIAIAVGLAATAGCSSSADLAEDRAEILERTCNSFLERRDDPLPAGFDAPTAKEFLAFLDVDAPTPHSVRALRSLCRPDRSDDT